MISKRYHLGITFSFSFNPKKRKNVQTRTNLDFYPPVNICATCTTNHSILHDRIDNKFNANLNIFNSSTNRFSLQADRRKNGITARNKTANPRANQRSDRRSSILPNARKLISFRQTADICNQQWIRANRRPIQRIFKPNPLRQFPSQRDDFYR